ncbi:Kinesin-like protein kif21b [Irineochytrium annulatum]|nr:Kinesin-like protein kif21b [Irineochytrium annulatum]
MQASNVRVAIRIRPSTPAAKKQEIVNSKGSPLRNASTPNPDPVVVAFSPTSLTVLKAGAQAGAGSATTAAAEGLWDFDAVYSDDSCQGDIYDAEVAPLVDSFMEGFNVTLLAYGQSGSGKTFTMGTDPLGLLRTVQMADQTFSEVLKTESLDPDDVNAPTMAEEITSPVDAHRLCQPDAGMIPRALYTIFDALGKDFVNGDTSSRTELRVSYLELHNEEWVDLLRHVPGATTATPAPVTTRLWPPAADPTGQITLREDKEGRISVYGATEVPVFQVEDALKLLIAGSKARATASTTMNERSSRSHAIFTLNLRTSTPNKHPTVLTTTTPTKRPSSSSSCSSLASTSGQINTVVSSKFNFVDLAGSERLKRTQSTGDRKQEGIAINQGLLVLGRVIHSLCEASQEGDKTGVVGPNGMWVGPVRVVPYRDSKLTRFLQDSLGGNSRTVMLACTSGVDVDLPETVNTLKYASRARAIKNRAKVNVVKEGPSAAALLAEMAELRAILEQEKARADVAELEVERLKTAEREAEGSAAAEREKAEAAAREVERLKLAERDAERLAALEREKAAKAEREVERLRTAEREAEKLAALQHEKAEQIEREMERLKAAEREAERAATEKVEAAERAMERLKMAESEAEQSAAMERERAEAAAREVERLKRTAERDAEKLKADSLVAQQPPPSTVEMIEDRVRQIFRRAKGTKSDKEFSRDWLETYMNEDSNLIHRYAKMLKTVHDLKDMLQGQAAINQELRRAYNAGEIGYTGSKTGTPRA